MAINFPTTIDTLTNPNTSDPQNSPSHAGQHSDANDAIEALEAKVGADSSAVTTSHDYKIAQLESTRELSSNKENTTIDTSTTKYPTVNLLKTVQDAIPTKAAGTDLDTGTDDAKFATAKAIKDSHNVPSVTPGTSGNVLTSNGTDWTSSAPALTDSSTTTFTNKRINPRLVTTASYTTDTGTSLDVSTCDQFEITAQAGALKFNNPGGTPLGGQKLIIRIKDNGTARALTYDTQFRAMGNDLPTTTVVNKTLYMGFIWNATDSKFDLVAVANEA